MNSEIDNVEYVYPNKCQKAFKIDAYENKKNHLALLISKIPLIKRPLKGPAKLGREERLNNFISKKIAIFIRFLTLF